MPKQGERGTLLYLQCAAVFLSTIDIFAVLRRNGWDWVLLGCFFRAPFLSSMVVLCVCRRPCASSSTQPGGFSSTPHSFPHLSATPFWRDPASRLTSGGWLEGLLVASLLCSSSTLVLTLVSLSLVLVWSRKSGLFTSIPRVGG